mmetsp:Transcript_34274/g.97147  ORF Transcript_34274/g.97147 Transcript_34274/m.97147 type:complete len:140 (+) Transcript_34274:111-530(+)
MSLSSVTARCRTVAPRQAATSRAQGAVTLRCPVPTGPPAFSRRTPRVSRAVQDGSQTSSTAEEVTSEAPQDVCKTCGVKLSEAPGGCDGLGRQAGGVGAVIDWWPIKAYRPCPALTASGGKYKRKGQITDEMLFGKGKK